MLADDNLRSKKSLRVLRLARACKAGRLAWSSIHRNWLLAQWSNVFFYRQVLIWIEKCKSMTGRSARLSFPQEVVPYQGGSYHTPLFHIPDKLTGNIYEENVLPRREEIGLNFIFMEYNARPHCTRRIQNVLAEALRSSEWIRHNNHQTWIRLSTCAIYFQKPY